MDPRRWCSWLHFPLWLLFVPMDMCGASVPVFSPFFFMCTHHGEVEDGRRTTEVAMSLRIAGNPKHYVPGRHYEVTLTTSADFNGLLVTGLYTSVEPSSRILPKLAHNPKEPAPALTAVSGPQPFASGFVCSIVTSHVAPHPQRSLSFVWEAPLAGTGCVSFMATATLHGQVIFKDTMVQQLCEKGAPTLTPMTLQLA
uniref:reelin-like n=1 Tax=Myxine glutinosa TaxID=7769 RepID=UPI00358FCEDF